MSRYWLAGCLVGLAAFSSGCCMCNAPYDYCGPVYADYAVEPCTLIDDRFGSAFSGEYMDQPAGYEGEISGEYVGSPIETTVEQAPASPAPGNPPAPRNEEYYDDPDLDLEPAPRSTKRPAQMRSALRNGRATSSQSATPRRGQAGRRN